MKNDWEGMQFQFVGYKDSGISILSSFDDIQVTSVLFSVAPPPPTKKRHLTT